MASPQLLFSAATILPTCRPGNPFSIQDPLGPLDGPPVRGPHAVHRRPWRVEKTVEGKLAPERFDVGELGWTVRLKHGTAPRLALAHHLLWPMRDPNALPAAVVEATVKVTAFWSDHDRMACTGTRLSPNVECLGRPSMAKMPIVELSLSMPATDGYDDKIGVGEEVLIASERLLPRSLVVVHRGDVRIHTLEPGAEAGRLVLPDLATAERVTTCIRGGQFLRTTPAPASLTTIGAPSEPQPSRTTRLAASCSWRASRSRPWIHAASTRETVEAFNGSAGEVPVAEKLLRDVTRTKSAV